MPLHYGDTVTYWSIDRASNLEWRRTTGIRIHSSKAQASNPETLRLSS